MGTFFTPGRRCRPDHRDLDDQRLPLLNGQPSTPLKRPIDGGWDYEAYEDSLTFTRPAFPLPTIPGWNENSFGFFPGLRTPQSPVTHAKAGTVLLTLNRVTPSSIEPPIGVTTHHARLSTSHGRPPSAPGTAQPVTSAGRSSM